MTSEPWSDVPELVIADSTASIVALLSQLQRAVLVHPEAAAALFRALVREGEAFARTSEGARLKQMLLSSELLERAELVWHAATQWIPEQSASGATASALVDAIAAAAQSPERDSLLEALFVSAQRGA